MRHIVILLLLLQAASPAADLSIRMEVSFNDRSLLLNTSGYKNHAGQEISISRLDWLLSEFRVHSSERGWLEATGQNAFFSVGKGRRQFTLTGVPSGEFDRVSFRVGLNPRVNASNPARFGPDDPLNPLLNGLHWSWQGGYVFLAVEGRWNKGTNSGGYSYHLGNDHMRMIVERPIKLSLPRHRQLRLRLNLDRILAKLSIGSESASTHGRLGDPIAEKLRAGTVAAFTVTADKSLPIVVPQSTDTQTVLINPQAKPYRFTFGRHFPPPRLPLDNPLTEEGVALGRRLFHDRALSVNGKQSCASCHQAEHGFVDGTRAVSLGTDGRRGTRNSMPLFNLAWKEKFFWDGRAPSLRAQVLLPIQSPIEMHESLGNVVAKLETAGYAEQFEAAFASPKINPDRLARALEQFLLTLISSNSKFDRAIRGKAELSKLEQAGFELFMTENEPRRNLYGADCFHCHGGPLFTSNGFANNGLEETYADIGVAELTGQKYDHGRFSVPSLRNIELTAPYMHDGRFKTLEEVVAHYSSGIRRSPALDPNLAKHRGGLNLSKAKQAALVAFLRTLTDDQYRRLAKMK